MYDDGERERPSAAWFLENDFFQLLTTSCLLGYMVTLPENSTSVPVLVSVLRALSVLIHAKSGMVVSRNGIRTRFRGVSLAEEHAADERFSIISKRVESNAVWLACLAPTELFLLFV